MNEEKHFSVSEMGTVQIVRRVDGMWSRWIGTGNAAGVVIGDAVELAGSPESMGQMPLFEYITRGGDGTL